MKKTVKIAFIFLAFIAITILSCENIDLTKPDADAQTGTDGAKVEDAIADAFGAANSGATSGGKATNACYTKTPITGGFEIDFGACSATGRSGKITVLVNSWSTVGGTLTITFNGYTKNGVTVAGTLNAVWHETTISQVVYPQLDLTSTNLTFTFGNRGNITVSNFTKSYVWIEGYEKPNVDESNDVYKINGTTVGTGIDKVAFTITNNNLLVKRSCGYPVSGTITLTKLLLDYTIDFGDGTCDNKATVSKGNIVIPITL